MSKSIILTIVGIILLGIATISANMIPPEAFDDYTNNQSKETEHRVHLQTQERETLFIKAHERRRLLQNFYIGASGLACLAAGLLALPNKKPDDISIESPVLPDRV
ncbi:MAG: hypothetical protein K9M57_03260 [Phycisphaerae bacterium]|nr:hypothetical protein [Phycisphaerae bacterium]